MICETPTKPMFGEHKDGKQTLSYTSTCGERMEIKGMALYDINGDEVQIYQCKSCRNIEVI